MISASGDGEIFPGAGPRGAANPELDFLLDDATVEDIRQPVGSPWRVLIVDDDESVHSISRVVLSDVRFQGRGVEILSAYSGRQAAAILRQSNDVAVVLLDVVMEDDDAGLKLVREIREEMHNTRLRITGSALSSPMSAVKACRRRCSWYSCARFCRSSRCETWRRVPVSRRPIDNSSPATRCRCSWR
jgi:CheY-like chemotaxis protein